MKFLLSIIVSIVVALNSVTHAEVCDVASFGALATSPLIGLCMKEANFSILTLTAAPTETQLVAFCASPSCQEFLDVLVKMDPPECIIPVGGRINLRSDLLEPVSTFCSMNGGSTDTSSTVGSAIDGSEGSVASDNVNIPTTTPSNGAASSGSAVFVASFALGTALAL